jgi:hypothetical protein
LNPGWLASQYTQSWPRLDAGMLLNSKLKSNRIPRERQIEIKNPSSVKRLRASQKMGMI